MMLSRPKRWLISLGFFLLFAGLCAFIGISVNHMTNKNGTEPSSESSSSAGSETQETTSEPETTTLPATSEQSTEESSSDETEPTTTAYTPAKKTEIKKLTDKDLEEIKAQYSIEPEPYILGEEMDASNRPVNCVNYNDRFSGISDKISVFNTQSSLSHEVSLFFVLTEEYDNNTIYILNRLAEKNVHATFFINMHYAVTYPEIVDRILREGHEVGSLGASSPDDGLAIYALEDQMNDMTALQEYVEEDFDYSMEAFYFRCDLFSEASLKMASDMGYKVRFYSIDYDDVSHTQAIDANEMLDHIKNRLHDGASIILHNANSATLIMLPNLINYLEDTHYSIVPLH